MNLKELASKARGIIIKAPQCERRQGLRDLEFTLYRHKLSMIHAKQLPEEEREFVEQQARKLAINRINLLIDAFKEEKE